MEQQKLFTLGQLAREVGVTERRVDYAIRTIGIEPVLRVGILRCFDGTAVEQLRAVFNIRRELAHA